MVYLKKEKSDSDYNLNTDEYSDNADFEIPKSPKQANQLNPLNSNNHPSNETNFNEYKKTAETWTIEQISEEISNLSDQLSKLKKSNSMNNKRSSFTNHSKTQARSARRRLQKNGNCFCRGRYSSSAPMVQCDSCKVWYHQTCVGLTQENCEKMDSFICDECKRERLEELDKRNDFNSNKIRKQPFKNDISKIMTILKNNPNFYHKSTTNFLSLFREGPKTQFKFTKRWTKKSSKNIKARITLYENQLKRLLLKDNNELLYKRIKKLDKSNKNEKFKRGNSVQRIDCIRLNNKLSKLHKQHESDGIFYDKEKLNKIKNLSVNGNEKLTKESLLSDKNKTVDKELNESNKKQPKRKRLKMPITAIKEKHDMKLLKKIKQIMVQHKLSQKAVAKMAKLTGGSTTLSSWLNDNYVYNVPEKEEQLRIWSENFSGTPSKKQSIDKSKRNFIGAKSKSVVTYSKNGGNNVKMEKGTKVDFLSKKKWVSGVILKATKGQYFVKFRTKNGTKKKWVASLAKRVYPAYTKRSK